MELKLKRKNKKIKLGYSLVEDNSNIVIGRLIDLVRRGTFFTRFINIEKDGMKNVKNNFFLICHAEPKLNGSNKYHFLSDRLKRSDWWNEHFFANNKLLNLYLFCCYGYNAFYWTNIQNKTIKREGLIAYRERLDFTLGSPEIKKIISNYITNIRRLTVEVRYTSDFHKIVIDQKKIMIEELDEQMLIAHSKKDIYTYTFLELQLNFGFQSKHNLTI